ncbi:hypothetical protein [Methylobacterium sp. J-070]|uniref:hypothetical protein n=1 Tax=Methylobacterium sp. J-070 TaxID=2836650 RepID=UPI001FB9BEFD|nr:hypothetical protein [Methylobacterium sp. J-070]MCJ2051210.1 hypothetical protein [Methylobacterium sp. J-070]
MTAKVLIRVERPDAPLPSVINNTRDLDRWRVERQEADAQVRSQVSQRSAMLASATVDAIAKKDAAISAARIRAERADAIVTTAERRLAEEEARQAAREPERRRRYAAGKKAAAEAERIMREEYGPAAAELADILSRLAELHAVVDAANADRPQDAGPLDPDAFRSLPSKPARHEIRTVEVLVDEHGQETKPPIRVAGGRSLGPDDGSPAISVSGYGNTGSDGGMRTELRERQVYVEASAAVAAPSLIRTAVVPGLAWNDAPFWPPAKS